MRILLKSAHTNYVTRKRAARVEAENYDLSLLYKFIGPRSINDTNGTNVETCVFPLISHLQHTTKIDI